jgi:hypothetical protein
VYYTGRYKRPKSYLDKFNLDSSVPAKSSSPMSKPFVEGFDEVLEDAYESFASVVCYKQTKQPSETPLISRKHHDTQYSIITHLLSSIMLGTSAIKWYRCSKLNTSVRQTDCRALISTFPAQRKLAFVLLIA